MNQGIFKVLVSMPIFAGRITSPKTKHFIWRNCVGGSKNKRETQGGFCIYEFFALAYTNNIS